MRLAADRATGARTVTVQAGQTLSGIAVAYAVPGGWSALAAYNGITDPAGSPWARPSASPPPR